MDNIRVLATGLRFPEGPEFDGTGNLWCAEREGGALFCLRTDGTSRRVHTGGHPSGSICHQGHLWFCDSGYNAIRRMNLWTEAIETVLSYINGRPLNGPNDLLFDDENNLLITCPGLPGDKHSGYIVVYSASGSVEIIADGLLYPKGLALLPNRKTLLITEAHQQRIWSGYWDTDGLSWETIHVWANVGEKTTLQSTAEPSGMATGPDGHLYVAMSGAGIIRVFSADGEFIRDIHLPGLYPSNCAFDQSGELGLVVTEIENGELLSISL